MLPLVNGDSFGHQGETQMSQACAQWRGDLGVYIIGAPDEAEHAGLERHLQVCEWCRTEYEDLIPVRDLLGRLAVAGWPGNLPAGI